MPRKKNKRHQKQKQLKIIQARLMEISLKMENYIYNNRPISMNDAQIYYQDVLSYKNQCGDNARILQVIDKLKLQLKALIEEPPVSADYYNVQELIENSIPTCPLSPTYSMEHEDISPSNNDNVHEIDNNITNDLQSKTIDTIDLCSDKNLDEFILTQTEEKADASISNIKEIERHLSNLTVHTENSTKSSNAIENTINYNKTVLANTQKQMSVDSVPRKRKSTHKTKEASVNVTSSKTNASSQDISKIAPRKLADNKIENNVPKRKRRTNKTKQNDTNKKEVPEKRRKVKTCNIQNTKFTTDIITDNNFTKSVLPTRTANNNNLIKQMTVLPHSKTHPVNAVYNSNVENDLSWIENIRYIREIAPDETDPNLTYLEDGFWLTLELPTNWTDQDFLY